MDKLPEKWTLRIFERLQCVFKERWQQLYEVSALRREILLTQWCTGLSGLTASEIKRAIMIYECYPHTEIPTVVDFYHYAKGHIHPRKPPTPRFSNVSTPETAKEYIRTIKENLAQKVCHVEQSTDE